MKIHSMQIIITSLYSQKIFKNLFEQLKNNDSTLASSSRIKISNASGNEKEALEHANSLIAHCVQR